MLVRSYILVLKLTLSMVKLKFLQKKGYPNLIPIHQMKGIPLFSGRIRVFVLVLLFKNTRTPNGEEVVNIEFKTF